MFNIKKTVSQKNLDQLVKEKGWKLTPDSKKAISDSKMTSTLTKSVEVITDLVRAAKGIEKALLTNKEEGDKKYLDVIDRLTEFLEKVQVLLPPASVEIVKQESESKEWKFTVKRNQEGMITEIEAMEK
jgi:dsDNA-binding SOS-regulon protein